MPNIMAYSSQQSQEPSFGMRNKGRFALRTICCMPRQKSNAVLIENLRLLMSIRGWSNRDLAKESRVSDRMIGKVLKGDAMPTTETLDKLSAAFDIEVYELMTPGSASAISQGANLSKVVDAYIHADRDGWKIMEANSDYIALRQETPANDPKHPGKKQGNGPGS